MQRGVWSEGFLPGGINNQNNCLDFTKIYYFCKPNFKSSFGICFLEFGIYTTGCGAAWLARPAGGRKVGS